MDVFSIVKFRKGSQYLYRGSPRQSSKTIKLFPNSVFEAVVKIPYDLNSKQVLASGAKGGLNVGAVVILPDGFKLAPAKQVPKEVKEKNKGVYISPYSSSCENILVVGPVGGDKHQEIVFPILSPDPATDSKIHFIK